MNPLDLITLALASWYLTYIVVNTDGTFRLFDRFRTRFPLGGLTACVYCTVPYVAIIVVLGWLYLPAAIQVVAICGLAMLFHRYTGGNSV